MLSKSVELVNRLPNGLAQELHIFVRERSLSLLYDDAWVAKQETCQIFGLRYAFGLYSAMDLIVVSTEEGCIDLHLRGGA